jgi:Na+-driven multidrug efflux pump
MANHEKSAWLTLVCMVVAYTIYFALVLSGHVGPKLLDILWPFGIITSIQAVVVIIGHIVLAITGGSEARAKPDERDRAIARRGANAGYYVLLIGLIVVGVVMPFSDPAPKVVNTALLAIVLAESLRHVLVILSYRRGWHG